LETAQENNVLLAGRLSAFQVRLLEVEDVLMEDVDAEGEPSDSSSDLDLVKNIVAIPIPGPSVVHTLVPVEVSSDFVPVTNSPFWPCFWPSTFFFRSNFTQHSKVTLKKTQKHHIKQ
jgi:hypothetical protein